MRKFYSIVLMAAALLIGTNVKAVEVASESELSTAISEAPAGVLTKITLGDNITLANNWALYIYGEKNVEIDLNGHNITTEAAGPVYIDGGQLTFSGSGIVSNTNSNAYFIYIKGSATDVANYSVFNVGEHVNMTCAGSYGIILCQGTSAKPHHAYGIVLNIDGYVQSQAGVAIWALGNFQDKTGNVPVINIGSNGQLVGADDEVCLYGGGYAIWNIEGTVEGGTGIYAKAGDYNITGNAVVRSTATTHEEVVANGDGYTGGIGCAIVADSKKGYAGDMEIAISGNATLESNAEGGYAIEEVKSDEDKSKTESIVIESGTINGNLKTTAEVKENIVLNGTITGGTFNQDITEYLNNVTGVITPTENPDGSIVYVINEKPTTAGDWKNTIVGAAATDYVRMENGSPVTLSADAQAEYLVMQGTAKIIVPEGLKLTVKEIVMGKDAVIEVAAGGKLIVTGAQGIVSNHASNLVLKTSKTAQAIFLLNPAVISNKHPNATVQLQTYSWYESSTSYQWQRFGIPTFGAVTSFECVENAVNTQIQAFDNGNWVSLGYIGGSPALNVADLNKPFVTYNLIANRAQSVAAPVYDIKGELVGNENASLNAYSEWNLFSNSYLAKVDVEAFLTDLVGVDQVVYIATPAGVGTYTWNARDLEWAAGVKLNPMAAFILHNPGEAAISAINYEKAVYDPATKGSSPAPRRFAQTSDKTAKLRVIVANEEGVRDDVKMTEKTSNLHNAAKYMNDDLNIYAMADEKAAIVAAEDLENTYVGFSTVKGGKFTISFANVEGREFTLVDHATGARVEIAEGNTYEFTADANSANDYRFEIVGRANMPTAIDNTEAVKSVKGIYTITGQYVGEMNVWNTLPAGVYVVNGEKRVK